VRLGTPAALVLAGAATLAVNAATARAWRARAHAAASP